MNKKKARSNAKLQEVTLTELKNLNENDMIVVKSIRVNSRLCTLESRRKNGTEEAVSILYKALNENWKKNNKSRVPTIEMSVSNIKKSFDLETTPANSFFRLKAVK